MREFVRKKSLFFSECNANIAYAAAKPLTHLVKDWKKSTGIGGKTRL